MLLKADDRQKIGRAGELLTQYKFLKYGIDSSPMTTDSGIDLIALIPEKGKIISFQVKTNLRPKPGGGKGKLALDWWIDISRKVDFFALVNLESDEIWIFSYDEMIEAAQQKPKNSLIHFYMYTDPSTKPKKQHKNLKYQFQEHIFENYIYRILDM